ncbi:hypothetical protein SLA2020_378390 [Shorea laevis]
MESQPAFIVYTVQNASDVEGFNQVLRSLLDRLRNRAASGNSTRKFAAGSEAVPGGFQTIYSLVQCTPDLDELECNNCLLGDYGNILGGMVGGRYGTPAVVYGMGYKLSMTLHLRQHRHLHHQYCHPAGASPHRSTYTRYGTDASC